MVMCERQHCGFRVSFITFLWRILSKFNKQTLVLCALIRLNTVMCETTTLAMKDSEEKSWFNYIKSILEKYNMPSAYALLEEQPSKSKWKQILKQSVHSYVEALWTSELESKQSLKYVNPVSLKLE